MHFAELKLERNGGVGVHPFVLSYRKKRIACGGMKMKGGNTEVNIKKSSFQDNFKPDG